MKKFALLLAACMIFMCCAASCGVQNISVPEYTPGVCTENEYSSDWLGIKFVPSEDMYLSTAAEIEELLGDGEGTTVYEMLATDVKTNDSVIVMVETVEDGLTVSDYVDALKMQMSSSEGITAQFGKVEPVRIAGQKFTRISYTIVYGGYGIDQTMYFLKRGDRMVSICVTANDRSAEDAIMSCFKAK